MQGEGEVLVRPQGASASPGAAQARPRLGMCSVGALRNVGVWPCSSLLLWAAPNTPSLQPTRGNSLSGQAGSCLWQQEAERHAAPAPAAN